MAAGITKHDILIRGQPTEVLTIGQTLNENPENLILIIPGNPGVASYYTDFMKSIYHDVGKTHSVWIVSHAGHSRSKHHSMWPGTWHAYNLEEQVKHKVAFIEDHVPSSSNITLVGHSIGSYIILKILNYFESSSKISFVHNYLLFPTVERMKITPNGKRLWPIFCYFRWLLTVLTAFVFILPEGLKAKILTWYFGGNISSCSVDATRELLHPRIIKNVLWMAYTELKEVQEADITTITKHKDKLTFYYGATDGWCPTLYRDELLLKVEGLRAHLCQSGHRHAFVLSQSEPMGKFMAQWIKASHIYS